MTPGSRPLLYDYWRSSASYRVRIGLSLKGLAYDRRPVDLLAGAQHGEAYRAVNPQGLLPSLEIDGLCLTQSLAILEYLEETRPEPPLLPAAPAERAQARAIALSIAAEVHPLCNPGFVARVMELAEGGGVARKAWMQERMSLGLTAVEHLVSEAGGDPFALGETPGLADCLLVPQLYNARRWGLDPAVWPRLHAIETACVAHPAIAAAHPDRFKPTQRATRPGEETYLSH